MTNVLGLMKFLVFSHTVTVKESWRPAQTAEWRSRIIPTVLVAVVLAPGVLVGQRPIHGGGINGDQRHSYGSADRLSGWHPSDDDRSAFRGVLTEPGFWQKKPADQVRALRSVFILSDAPEQVLSEIIKSAPINLRGKYIWNPYPGLQFTGTDLDSYAATVSVPGFWQKPTPEQHKHLRSLPFFAKASDSMLDDVIRDTTPEMRSQLASLAQLQPPRTAAAAHAVESDGVKAANAGKLVDIAVASLRNCAAGMGPVAIVGAFTSPFCVLTATARRVLGRSR
jgi:hypothetical protein